MNFEPWPYFEDDEIKAVTDVLRSGKVNQWTGSQVVSFEKEFAHYMGSKYAVALANGSLALDLALMGYGIQKGDEVIVTPRSFVASASCVALKGAVPVFVDVDPVSQNVTTDNIAAAITNKTKAVIAVNLAGWPCDLHKIQQLCRDNDLILIEDCAQSHGAAFNNRKAGSFGDCAVFSFCQDKIMTTGGEGGMVVIDNKDVWERVWSYKDHGKEYPKSNTSMPSAKFRWLTNTFGTNCRMTEMQATMGRVMLKKLDGWVEQRRTFAKMFNEAFVNLKGLRTTIPSENIYHSYYKYYVFIDPAALKSNWTCSSVLNALREKGIPCNSGICPEIYLEKAFANSLYRIQGGQEYDGALRLPVAKKLGETSMMFMVHPTLKDESIQFVVDQVRSVMTEAVR